MARIVRAEDLRTIKAPATGIYEGPDRGKPIGKDTRFFKAGSDIPAHYRLRVAAPPPAAEKAR